MNTTVLKLHKQKSLQFPNNYLTNDNYWQAQWPWWPTFLLQKHGRWRENNNGGRAEWVWGWNLHPSTAGEANPRKCSNRFPNNYKAEFALKQHLICGAKLAYVHYIHLFSFIFHQPILKRWVKATKLFNDIKYELFLYKMLLSAEHEQSINHFYQFQKMMCGLPHSYYLWTNKLQQQTKHKMTKTIACNCFHVVCYIHLAVINDVNCWHALFGC